MPSADAPAIAWTDLIASAIASAQDLAYGHLPGDPSTYVLRGEVAPADGGTFATGQAIHLGDFPPGAWTDETPQHAGDGYSPNYIGVSVHIGLRAEDGEPRLAKMEISPTGRLTAYAAVAAQGFYLNGVTVARPIRDSGEHAA